MENRKKDQVIAAVIQKNGKFLLGRRSAHKKHGAGYWCPVSGQIEKSETEQQAVVREVFEEVGVSVCTTRKLGESDTRDGNARIHWWEAAIIEGEPRLANDEHSELRWVTMKEMKALTPIFEEDFVFFEKATRPASR